MCWFLLVGIGAVKLADDGAGGAGAGAEFCGISRLWRRRRAVGVGHWGIADAAFVAESGGADFGICDADGAAGDF